MNRLPLLPLFAAAVVAAGCGPTAPTGPHKGTITWEQYQKMSAEDRDDPYVLNNLDDDARKKFDEQARKKKR